MAEKLTVLCLFTLMSCLPGAFIRGPLQSLNAIGKTVSIVSVSLAFWILFVWFAALLMIPLTPVFMILLGGMALFFLVQKRKQTFSPVVFKENLFQRKDPSFFLFLATILYLLYPYFFMTIPPGNDISMHGYISRLIINNNGLPQNYDPFLPDSPFGSYSAGYQALTSLAANLNPHLLKEAINLLSIVVFSYLLLATVFLFSFIFKGSLAIYTSVITILISSSILTTVGWGGTPTILAFAYCLVFFATILFAIRQQNNYLFLLSSLYLASIPMIHAIPAVTFVYFYPAFFAWLLFRFRQQATWITLRFVYSGLIAIVLLLPFLIEFKNDSSPELTAMIREWQHNMMNFTLNDSFGHNLIATLGQIKYRAGDPLVILFFTSLAAMIVYKPFRPAAWLILLLLAYLFVLVFNSAYWFLPLSEVLYPERVMYFMILLMGIPTGYLLSLIHNNAHVLRGKQQIIYAAVISILMVVGISRSWEGYTLSILRNNNITCDTPTMAAFEWIEQNTPEDAVFRCTYADAGIWIPTFANRATLGAHIHFIHEVSGVNALLEKRFAPKYLFVTQKDEKDLTPITGWAKQKNLVFENQAIKIYR